MKKKFLKPIKKALKKYGSGRGHKHGHKLRKFTKLTKLIRKRLVTTSKKDKKHILKKIMRLVKPFCWSDQSSEWRTESRSSDTSQYVPQYCE